MIVRKNINFHKNLQDREDVILVQFQPKCVCQVHSMKMLHLFIHLASNSISIDDHVVIRAIREKEEAGGGDQEISIESEISW